MTETEDFKIWLQSYLLDLDKDIDTDVYLEYIYEILTTFSPNPSNKTEIIENLHSILESLLPDIKIIKSDEIFTKYLISVLNKEVSKSNAELDKTDFLSEIIKKDKNAIDKNKRLKPTDPRYALDYKSVDLRESDEDSFSDGEIDAQFATMRVESCNKIDDVMDAFEPEKHQGSSNQNNDKLEAIAITRDFLLKKNLISDDDDSDDRDYNPISDECGKSNREAVEKASQELRVKMKEQHQLKKEKDKQDRNKQKELVKARKENEKKRTQKSEKRRG